MPCIGMSCLNCDSQQARVAHQRPHLQLQVQVPCAPLLSCQRGARCLQLRLQPGTRSGAPLTTWMACAGSQAGSSAREQARKGCASVVEAIYRLCGIVCRPFAPGALGAASSPADTERPSRPDAAGSGRAKPAS